MRELILTNGSAALVDDEDYEWATRWRWRTDSSGYVFRTQYTHMRAGKCVYRKIYIHREIAQRAGIAAWNVDHENLDRKDSRRANLRPANRSQNMANRAAPKTNTSGQKGVYFDNKYGRWRARIMVNYHGIHLGSFDTKEEAAEAYMRAAENAWGEYAHA